MACYDLFMVFGILVLALCSNDGLEREQHEDRQQGRGRLHQHCKVILNEKDFDSREGLPKHDRIRHYRQRTKCKHHMRAEEDCRKKYKPANGTVRSFYDNFYGWVVSVSCHRGYTLRGQSPVICYEDLKENERPFCEIKECPSIKNPAFGKHHETQNANGDQTIFFECTPGYRLVGANETSCYYGMWTSPEPICIQSHGVVDDVVCTNPNKSTCSVRSDKSTSNGVLFGLVGLLILIFIMASVVLYIRWRRRRRYAEAMEQEPSIDIEPAPSILSDILSEDIVHTSGDSGYSDIHLSNTDTSEQSDNSNAQHDVQVANYIFHTYEGILEQSGSHVVYPTDEVPSTSDVTSLSEPFHTVCRMLGIHVLNNRVQLPTCRVPPLKAGDEQANDAEISQQHTETGQELVIKEKDSPADASELNWNKLFSYLVPKLCTVDWRLFAVELLSRRLPHGQSADKTVSQIETRSKTQHGGEKIEIILLNIFWYWKNLEKSASLHDIEAALLWGHYEDVIHNMKDVVRTFYEAIDDVDRNSGLNQNVLAGIPELQYRIEPKESEIALLPCFEERADTHEMVPVTPFTEARMTCDYRFAASAGLHYHSDKRFDIAKRRYSYIKYQKLCNRYKFPARNRIPLRRRKPKAKSKVEVNKNAMTVPRSGEVLSFTEVDTTCVQLIYRILDLDPSKELNPTEFRLLTKHVLYKIYNTTPKYTEFNDILGITFEEFSLCDHVSTPKNCSLHIINSAKVMVILKDEEWSLVEKYVRRARNGVVQREPEIDRPHLFLTYEGYQVTNEYLQVNMKSSVTAERTNDTESKDNKAALDTSDQTDAMDTDKANKPPKVTLAQMKNQKFDVKRKLPVSRRSNYGGHANKVTTGSDVQVRHGRRYFCEKQTVTIETVFKEDIRQGSVKESTILSRFLNCNDLREAFGVESNNVDKILVKKVADRVRCFIRRRKN